jgi:hypothetical protein
VNGNRLLHPADFSCAPSRRKPITVARGRIAGSTLLLEGAEAITTLAGFEALLAAPGPWLGAFDFPFGLPREFVDSLGLGDSTAAVITEVQRRCPTRMDFRALIDQWGNANLTGTARVREAPLASQCSSPLRVTISMSAFGRKVSAIGYSMSHATTSTRMPMPSAVR